jgi:hypothetical protein
MAASTPNFSPFQRLDHTGQSAEAVEAPPATSVPMGQIPMKFTGGVARVHGQLVVNYVVVAELISCVRSAGASRICGPSPFNTVISPLTLYIIVVFPGRVRP